MTASTPDADYAPALTVLREAIAGGGWVLCLGHVQPDGDALGSTLALAYAIERAGGRAVVSFDPGPLPFGMPPSLHFLPGRHLLVPPARLLEDRSGDGPGPAAVVTFDTGSAERLGQLEPFVHAEVPWPVLVVDHHARRSEFGSVALVRADAAATAEIVADLIDRLGVAFDVDMATCLYTALTSDTGSFRYAATSAQTHQLAARLLTAGVPHAQVSSLLWDTRPAAFLTVLTRALQRLRRDGELIWTYVELADFAAAGASLEEAEGVIDVIRVAQEHEVAVVLKPEPVADQPCWKVSLRSRGSADVGAAAARLGGGGHRLAAGFTAPGSPEQIIARLRAALHTGT